MSSGATKRSPSKKAKLSLEKIVGTTSRHNSSLSVNPISNSVAYAAGGVVVIYSPTEVSGKQFEFLLGTKPKGITCLAFSANGKYLAAGESGHMPAILVWDLTTKKIVSELKGHKFGVGCLGWSPNGKFIVSVGYQRDQFLHVWDWRQQQIVSSNKISNKIFAISFFDDNQYFVTSGTHHLKIWQYADAQGILKKTDKSYKGRAVLEGRMALLGDKHKDYTYIDVCYAPSKDKTKQIIFAVSTSGWLIQVDPNSRRVEKWVNMKTPKALGLSVNEDMIVVACDNGTVRVFDTTLNYVTTLPRPNPLGHEAPNQYNPFSDSPKLYADTVACKVTPDKKVICFYSNRSMFIWDVKDIKAMSLYQSFLGHAACIWDITTAPDGTFITASADSTIRFWNLNNNNKEWKPRSDQNIFSKEMKQCISIGNDVTDFQIETPLDLENLFIGQGGLRCVALSPDRTHLASGDRLGNLRVHELTGFSPVCTLAAHDGEIMRLDYSGGDPMLLATGSRDRLIHIFERIGHPSPATSSAVATDPYSLRLTLDDHTSSIIALRFTESSDCTKLVSCGADRTLLFRNVVKEGDEIAVTRYHREIVSGPTCDMEIDPEGKELIVVGCDKKLPVWSLANGKKIKSAMIHDIESKAGKDVKVAYDHSGQFVATSSQDHYIRLYDVEQGTLLARVCGHSELITGIKFLSDHTHLVSVSGDGCIFIWKLSPELSSVISRRTNIFREKNPRERNFGNSGNKIPEPPGNILPKQNNSEFRFDPDLLPLWARRRLPPGTKFSEEKENFSTTFRNSVPRGKWTYDTEKVRLQLSRALTVETGLHSETTQDDRSGGVRNVLSVGGVGDGSGGVRNVLSVGGVGDGGGGVRNVLSVGGGSSVDDTSLEFFLNSGISFEENFSDFPEDREMNFSDDLTGFVDSEIPFLDPMETWRGEGGTGVGGKSQISRQSLSALFFDTKKATPRHEGQTTVNANATVTAVAPVTAAVRKGPEDFRRKTLQPQAPVQIQQPPSRHLKIPPPIPPPPKTPLLPKVQPTFTPVKELVPVQVQPEIKEEARAPELVHVIPENFSVDNLRNGNSEEVEEEIPTENSVRLSENFERNSNFSQWKLDIQRSRERLCELGLLMDLPQNSVGGVPEENGDDRVGYDDDRMEEDRDDDRDVDGADREDRRDVYVVDHQDDDDSYLMGTSMLGGVIPNSEIRRFRESVESPIRAHLRGSLISEILPDLEENRPTHFDGEPNDNSGGYGDGNGSIDGDGYGDSDGYGYGDDSEFQTEKFLGQLRDVFDQSVVLYEQMSRFHVQDKNSHNPVLEHFRNLFGHMKSHLDRIQAEQCDRDVVLLERYSDMLVEMVRNKLRE